MLYKILGVTIAIIVLAHFFNVAPAVQTFVERIADIPLFANKGDSPAIFDLAVRLAYLIAIIGALRLVLARPKAPDDE